MTQKLSLVEQVDDFIRKSTPNDKWFRYFDALTNKYANLWRIREQEREKLDHFMRKCRDLEEENSKRQAHIVKLKAALEAETQEHHVAKLQLKKLMGQLRSAKDYMLGLDAQDEKTTDLINTICASPHPYRMASATTLGNKSGSLLDDYEENSLSTEGSVTTDEHDVFQSFRKETGSAPQQFVQGSSMDSTATSLGSTSSEADNVAPLRRSLRKRGSSDEDEMVMSKKVKGGEVSASLTVSVDEKRRMVAAEARIVPKSSNRRRSKSVDARLDPGPEVKLPSAPSQEDIFLTPSKVGSPLYRSNSASKLTNKQHSFISKTVMVFENCAKCKRRLKFYKEALRCIECNVAVHQECREDAPLPCIPSVFRTPVKGKHKLSEFCPTIGPRVPPLLINCFHELEKTNRVKEVGLYRMSGMRTEVQAVARKLQKQVNHDLSSYDTHTVTGVVKDFLLHSLSEPLIPSSVYNRFAKITEPDNESIDSNVRHEVEALPPCNRDTLAFVMLHIGHVEQITENRMDRECLTRVFAPSIVGYSLQAQMNPALLNQEVTQRIMAALMNIDPAFWDNIIQRAQRKATLMPRDRTPHSTKTLNFASPKII